MWMLSVAFQLDDEGGRMSSAGGELVGVSDAGQSFPSSSRPDDTDYGTSELESVVRGRVDYVSRSRVHEAAGMGLPCTSGIACSMFWVPGAQIFTLAIQRENF